MHELGHNLGFGHSGAASPTGATLGTYSDGTSEMVRTIEDRRSDARAPECHARARNLTRAIFLPRR